MNITFSTDPQMTRNRDYAKIFD